MNIRRAILNYAHKKIKRSDAPISENVHEKFKDGADLIRYLVVWMVSHGYYSIGESSDKSDEYELFKEGRIPPKYRHRRPESPITPDMQSPGRKVIVDW